MNYLLFDKRFVIESKNYKNILIAGSWIFFEKNIDAFKKNCNNYFLLKFKEEKIISNFEYLERLYEKIIIELADQLNFIHKINKSYSYWRILLGPWVQYFLQATFLKWSSIDNISKKNFFCCHLTQCKEEEIIPLDFEEFSRLANDPRWNSHIISEIIRSKYSEFNILSTLKDKIEVDSLISIKKSIFISLLNFFLKPLRNYCRYVFIRNYSGLLNELKIQFKLFNIPFIYNFDIKKPNKKIINRKIKLKITAENNYEIFLQRVLNSCFPKSFLEFYSFYKSSSLIHFPKKPKATISTVHHQIDDFYKIWIAENKEKFNKEFKFYICQHGGYLGMSSYNFNTYTDINNCDKYLSWGWKNNIKNVIPVGFLINYNKKKDKKKKKYISFIMYSFHAYIVGMSQSVLQDKNLFYFEQQLNLLAKMSNLLKDNLVVRLPINNNELYIDIMKKKFPYVKIDKNKFSMQTYDESKLVITTHNSTAFLQSIFLDTPTIGVWNKKDMMVNDYAKKKFSNLEKNNVIVHNYSSGYNVIKEIYKNPIEWWHQKNRRKSINNFKETYCSIKNNFNNYFYNEFKK